MDFIFVEGIELEALIGVYTHERSGMQPLRIDLRIGTDLARSGSTDTLDDTTDYAEVVEEVRRCVTGSRHLLLETLAASLCDALMSRWPSMASLQLTIHKPVAAAALGCSDVGISVTRSRVP